MKSIFNIFTILKQIFRNMIVRIAELVEGLILESYFVNYKFKTSDNVHYLELPLILEVRNEMELNMLHARITSSICDDTRHFAPMATEDPLLIDKDKKKGLLDKYQVSDDRNISGIFEFVKGEDDINKDSDVPTKKLAIRTITTRTPKKLFGEVYAIGTIKDLFKFQIPTNGLK